MCKSWEWSGVFIVGNLGGELVCVFYGSVQVLVVGKIIKFWKYFLKCNYVIRMGQLEECL